MSIAEVIALIAGLGAFVTAVATGLKNRADAELAAKQSDLSALQVTENELQERNTQLYNRVGELEGKLEQERTKRRELEDVVRAKDTRIVELEEKVRVLEKQLEELEQTPKTRKKTV